MQYMSLFKASAVSAIGAGIKLLAGLMLIKLVAITLGPTGLGLMGQFMSLTSILILLAGGGIATGITKYVAQYKQNEVQLSNFLSTARAYSLVASIILFVLGILAAEPLSFWMFKKAGYAFVIYMLSVVQFGIALNTYILSVVSGNKDIVTSNIINTCGTLLGMLILAPLVYVWSSTGMLVGLTILPAVPSIISLYIAHRKYPTVLKFEWYFNKSDAWKLFKFSLMLLTSAVTMPVAQMLLRSHIVEQSGWEQVGYWQATVRLSDAYLLFINMVLAGYYMPKLSELGPGTKQIGYVKDAMKRMLPLLALCVTVIWYLRTYLITMLFSKEFLLAADLFTFQLIGDFFKIGSFMIGYVVVANAWTRLSIIGDIMQASMFYCIALILSSMYQIKGVSIGYAISYILYFIIIFTFFIYASRRGNL